MSTPVNLSVIKAFRILNAFEYAGEKLSLSQLSRRLDMNIATTHRFLITLQSVGALVKTPDGAFELGLLLADLGGKVSNIDVMNSISMPHVKHLAERFGETIHAAILDNDMVCYVAKGEVSRSLTLITHIGKRLPAYCTGLGKAMMSTLEEAELQRCIGHQSFKPFTNKTTIDPAALLEALNLTRERGYALDDEEVEIGLRCVAVPIAGCSNQLKAAISLSAPTTRLDQAKIAEVAQALREHARQIGEELAAKP
ncbi:IclR family transcriptional regulator [Pseudomonas taeanensis MS-3]|uniref:IclR family transcriptional regulator n=1 Tax=Pseudomonas taeanensis MS-3 TaxID=1395571 RepID=A0A0A1YPC7_9PSED|nr:IclR family transcriptional regulator [Pseudomonas taeanensis]KFX71787.1 IclR family transcriptional regulator [Pseudomonas taeanensis MS-3]